MTVMAERSAAAPNEGTDFVEAQLSITVRCTQGSKHLHQKVFRVSEGIPGVPGACPLLSVLCYNRVQSLSSCSEHLQCAWNPSLVGKHVCLHSSSPSLRTGGFQPVPSAFLNKGHSEMREELCLQQRIPGPCRSAGRWHCPSPSVSPTRARPRSIAPG